MTIDRRQFLILSGAAAVGEQLLGAAESSPLGNSSSIPWHQKLKRVGQLNANERDPIELDVNAWADYWAGLKVDAVLISVTGMVAFYPTAIPFHRRTPFLGNRDLFGDCCSAAKKRGLRVIARFSPDLQWEDALKAHPEWFRRDRDGKFVPHLESPGLFNTCMFSTYFTEQTPAIMREINSRYDVDGLFTNGWPPLGDLPTCYCEACKGKADTGTPAFLDRHTRRSVELWKLYDSIAKEKRPDNIYFANLGGGVRALIDLKVLGEQCFWFNCDNQGRGGDDTPAWGCAQQGRVARTVMKGRTITNVTGAWATGKVKWRNTAKTPAETEMWLAQTVASGMRIWYHWIGGQTGLGEDHRWQEPGRQFCHWMARHDEHFTYKRSIANLGVVFAQRPNSFYKPPAAGAGGYSEYMQGLYYALLEGRFFFDFVHEDDLGPENLKKYSALILPNVALLSDQQCEQLKTYADAGGSLLATFETGLYDRDGKRRGDFGLADLFGINRAAEIQGPDGNSFFERVERQHEILGGLENTSLLPGAEYRVPVKAAGRPVLTVVPPYPAYPPERAYAPVSHTDEPAVVISEKGRSRLIYFPGDIERTAWRSGNTDVSQLLQNSIHWILRGKSPVTVDGQGVVEMFAWETDPGFAVHILNYNNPNLHKGWIRRHSPIGPQTVRMELPEGTKVAQVQLLRAEAEVEFKQTGASVEFVVPKVNDYEVAAMTRA
jgi:Hypothetical glycosyl hydrolase 6/Beta-galactosidase trimerisation domain